MSALPRLRKVSSTATEEWPLDLIWVVLAGAAFVRFCGQIPGQVQGKGLLSRCYVYSVQSRSNLSYTFSASG